MWKVEIYSKFDGDEPGAIYWVNAGSADEANAAAMAQARATMTGSDPARVIATQPGADDDGQQWPRPRIIDGIRVHEFTDTRSGYDQTQYRPDIHDGDVLWVPGERVAGFLMQAWPTAVTVACGQFHALADPDTLIIDGRDYAPSAAVARQLISGRPWTVTIAGPERHDGERPYDWVVAAEDGERAVAAALAAHLCMMDADPGSDPAASDQYGEPTYRVVAAVEGLPCRGPGWYNDARPGADVAGEHDCLAVEDLRHRALTWVQRADTCHAGDTRLAAALSAEAAAIVAHLAAVFDRGLA